MAWRYEIRLGGTGGQGLIFMGIILAEAVGLYEGKYVAQTQSYGPEARGGSSKAEVVVSDEEIDYPKAAALDLLVALSQKACDEFYGDLKSEGLLLADSTFISQLPPVRTFRIPFTRIARETFHREMVANIIALGALTELTPVVSAPAMETAILGRVPKGTEQMNREALEAGRAAAKEAKKEGPTSALLTEVPRDGLLGFY